MSCIFLVGDYHIWNFTDIERKSVGLESVINTYQLPIHSGMDIVNVTVGCKNCCIISKCIWFEDLYMSLIYKRKSTGTPNVMFDIEELQFLIETYCFLLLKYDSNQCCTTPLMQLCRSLLIKMLWLTVLNAFEKYWYTATVLCLLSNVE